MNSSSYVNLSRWCVAAVVLTFCHKAFSLMKIKNDEAGRLRPIKCGN